MVIFYVGLALLALAVLGALHWYLWRRLVRDTTRGPGLARRLGAGLFVAGPLLMVAAMAGSRSGLPFLAQQILAWPGFLWAALLIYLLLAVLVGEVLRPLLIRVRGRGGRAGDKGDNADKGDVSDAGDTGDAGDAGERGDAAGSTVPAAPGASPAEPERTAVAATVARHQARPAPSRRLFVSRIVGGAAAAAAVGTVAQGTYGVLRGPRVKNVTIPLAKLARGADGYRVAVVSDIHLGPILGRAHTQRIVDTINSTQPDLVAIVGDLVDGSVANLGPAAEPLSGLRARHGSFFVTGNHEYYSGADAWIDRVRELGVHPLENARVELPGFDLAGVNDISGEDHHAAPDYGKALGDRDTARAAVLLAHQPVMIHDAVKHGVDLQLSGHTHGGQLFPGNLLARLANPTVAGLDQYGDTTLYVTRGAGAWGPPVRVGAPSDITVVKLASRAA